MLLLLQKYKLFHANDATIAWQIAFRLSLLDVYYQSKYEHIEPLVPIIVYIYIIFLYIYNSIGNSQAIKLLTIGDSLLFSYCTS